MSQVAPTTRFEPGGHAHAQLALLQRGSAAQDAGAANRFFDPEAIRELAMRSAQTGIQRALEQTRAELMLARARGDEAAIARLERQVEELEQALRQVAREMDQTAAQSDAGAATADAQAARAGAQAVVAPPAPPPPIPNALPDGVVALSIVFFAVVVLLALGLPIARAFGRRGTQPAVMEPDPQTQAELRDIRHTVEAIAIEVERIAESQRFLAGVRGTPGEAVPADGGSSR